VTVAPTTTPASRIDPVNDPVLVERLRAGDEAAFDDLVRLAGGRMLTVARRMLGNEDDAADAVQDAFLSAFKGLGRFDGRSQLTTWLHRITVNACLMKLRSRRRRPERTMEHLMPRFLEDGHQEKPPTAWKPIDATGIEGVELLDLVRAKIAELPHGYREVLLLRDIEELDTEETAILLGMSAAAVKTRLHRARQALKALLDPCMAEEETR
jgi:RNA polymerase sigma-70 factor (ECF subfamily)